MSTSGFVRPLDLDQLTPVRLWASLSPELRLLAANALYTEKAEDSSRRLLADAALAKGMRFRLSSVRKLPLEKRTGYLARAVAPDDALASGLLQALHLSERRPLLVLFQDTLGIPHKDGVIDPEHSREAPSPEALEKAAEKVLDQFPEADVQVYLASLYALEPDFWSGLRGVLGKLLAG